MFYEVYFGVVFFDVVVECFSQMQNQKITKYTHNIKVTGINGRVLRLPKKKENHKVIICFYGQHSDLIVKHVYCLMLQNTKLSLI